MKIVHVCITGPWDEKYAYQENLLPHYHRMMGHDVTILAPVYSLIGYGYDGVKPVGTYFLPDGSKVVRLPSFFGNNRVIDSHLHLVRGLKDAILVETPDLLFIHDVCSLNFLCVTSIKKKLPHIKVVYDNHSDLVNSLHSPLTRFLHKGVYRYLLIPHLVNNADLFYGVTPSRCSFLHDIYKIPYSKIKLLVMGADDEKMMLENRDVIRSEVRGRYHISEHDFLIVTGGKIDKDKNIHVLAHAVNSIKNEKLKLLVFGKIKEEMQPFFEAEKSTNILTIGWVDSDKVYELFYAADLIVFPGLHSVLWEQAVASKTPCAFSKMDGFDHVNVNDNCILMTGKDSNYYARMLMEILDSDEKYHSLKANSNSDATEQFYYSKIARQVLTDVKL